MIGKNSEKGFILASLIIVTTLVIMLGVAITQLVINNYVAARSDVTRLNAQFSSDAGIDFGLNKLNENNDWSGTGGELTLLENDDSRTTIEVVVEEGINPNQKTITSTGRTYLPASSSNPKHERTFQATVEGLTPPSGEAFSLVTGVGGLYMTNSAKIVAGDVYVNGEISMTNSSQIGLSSAPVTVKVAHQNCPTGGGSSYPQICTSGQPINVQHPARIYGEVQATNQTNSNGMSNPGLVAGSPPPQPLPPHDRMTQINNVVTTTSDSYYTNCWGNQTRTWPARLRIVGDVNISNSCEVTINGDVWITGNLNLSNSAKIRVANGITLGGQNTVNENMPTIMIDGSNGINISNNTEIAANSDGVGAQITTYWSTDSCTTSTTSPCELAGSALFNSRSQATIRLSNNASAASSIFYARWTQVELNNGGDVGAVVGQTVRLTNSAAITFGASVESGGEGTSTTTFIIRDYRRIN